MNGKYIQYLHGLAEMASDDNPFVSASAERRLEQELEKITDYLELEIPDDPPLDESELSKHFRELTNKLQDFSDKKD